MAVVRLAIFLWAVLVPFVAWAEESDPWIGKTVLLKPGAAFVNNKGKAVDQRLLTLPTVVREADKDRVWLGRGWVKKTDVISPDEALTLCDEKLKADAKDPKWWLLRGLAWHHKAEYQKAGYSLDEALRLDPSLCEALLVRGLGRHLVGNHETACRDFTAAIDIDPAHPVAFLYRGSARTRSGQLTEARGDYDRVIELDPGCSDAFHRRGDLSCYQRDFEPAIADYTEAIRLHPKNFAALGNRAFCRARLGESDKAMNDIDAAIRLKPQIAMAHAMRSVCWLVKGDCEKAIESISEGIRLEPQSRFPYILRARMYRSLGDDRKALEDYDTLLRIAPKDHTPKIDIVWIFANSEDPEVFDAEKAIAMAQELCRLTDWQHHDALASLAAGHAARGDWDKAIRLHKEATLKTPEEFQEHRKNELRLYESHKRAGPTSEQFKKTIVDMFLGAGPVFGNDR